ncbi:family 4 glycosyl hydrolase [Puniceicoccus vermicola]|uniref:Glycoside hydrolase family 4 n=1 Tax=Puniceicoccus vermicola TaxID=388746 RepID=A0A7X1E7L2_9BACT|nr:glycoside hydrolase family 4 [Puniceicoccus vermicola]MBC2603862.1 glycoside hydrolase family 4 [Puniceicoccus vermicola]
MKKNPTLTLIGAGSLFFARQAIWAMHHLPGLRGGTLRLVDTDSANLERMHRLAEKTGESIDSPSRFEAYENFRDALPGSDFVVLSFSKDNAKYREIDCRISAKYGIRMCSGDTIGPGGVFRTLREYRPILEISQAVQELCPDAWLINYVNPSAIFGIMLMRTYPGKYFALCDAQHLPYQSKSYLRLMGEDPERHSELETRAAGVNHFTFLLSATFAGEDVFDRLHEAFRSHGQKEKDQGYSKGRFNNTITAQLGDVFGALPTVTGHTKEYLPYYQGRSAIQESVPPLSVFDCDERTQWTADMWSEVESYLDGSVDVAEFHKKYKSDHATDIIHTMCVEDGRCYNVNVPNRADDGSRPVPNLPEDAFLEMQCRFDAKGPHPKPVGPMPLGLRGLQMGILDCHELTVQACLQKNRQLLVRALAMDPLVNSIATAEAVLDELYEAEKSALESWVGEKTARKNSEEELVGISPKLF